MRAFHVVLLASLAAVGLAAACKEDDYYVYTGQRWNADQGCLEDYKPIERVPGNDVSSNCPASCFTVDQDTYVTTVCGALPFNANEADPKTSPCKEALAAAAKQLNCSSIDASAAGDAADEGGDDGGDQDVASPPADAGGG